MPIKPKRLPVVREDRTIEIHLTQGYVAFIDWADAWAAGRNWSALVVDDKVYAVTHDGPRVALLHREIAGLGPRDGNDVDHVNGDTLDCRRANLRVVSHQKNLHNRRINRNNTSGYVGVRRAVSGRWYASISGQHLGTFDTPELANEARLAAERGSWGIQPRRVKAHSLVKRLVYTPRPKLLKINQ